MARPAMPQKVKDAIIESLGKTGKYSLTAKAFKIDVSTIYKVRLQDPEFAEKTANAIASSRVESVEQVFDIERNAALTGYFTYLKPVVDPATGEVTKHVPEFVIIDPTVRRKLLEGIKLDNAKYFGVQRAANVVNNNSAAAIGGNYETPEEPVKTQTTDPAIKEKLAELRDAIKKSQKDGSPDDSYSPSK